MPNPTADPYLPDHGDPRHHVEHYHLDLAYKPASNHLQGRATLTIRALEDLRRITLDLYALQVTKVGVKIAGRRVALERWQHRGSRLSLKLRSELEAGAGITVEVHYRGQPRTMPGPDGRAGWEELTDGAIVASQPHGSPSWFPCNDRSDDKARYDIEVTTPVDYGVVANGDLLSVQRRGGSLAWHYRMAEPMAPYLATVAIARFAVTDLSAPPGLGVPVRLACPPALVARAERAFADQGAMVAYFVELLGDYPFSGGYTAVVTDDALEIPLESQGLSTFGSNLLSRDWDAQRLIAHELSHQWFGNSVTAARLGDIWLHEGFACYSEWLWSQQVGHRSVDEWAEHHWSALRRAPQDLEVGRPGPALMFDDRVYKRGAVTLHALRRTIGDPAFFDLLREWVRRHRHGVVVAADFVALAEEVSGASLAALFDQWLYAAPLPALPGR